jgi:hypothetical protein
LRNDDDVATGDALHSGRPVWQLTCPPVTSSSVAPHRSSR